jgi:hypothetical protein
MVAKGPSGAARTQAASRSGYRAAMIRPVAGVATSVRTVLVVSAVAHPWALVRDALDPELATVRWAEPELAGQAAAWLRPWPWAVLGQDASALEATCPQGRPSLRIEVSGRGGWPVATALVRASLVRSLAGVCLAPARGLRLPGGRLVGGVPELEALVGAGPAGLQLAVRHRRRAAEQLRRLALPGLALAERDGHLVLEVGHVGAA